MTNDQLGPHDFSSPGPHEEANQGQTTWKWVAILALVALGIGPFPLWWTLGDER